MATKENSSINNTERRLGAMQAPTLIDKIGPEAMSRVSMALDMKPQSMTASEGATKAPHGEQDVDALLTIWHTLSAAKRTAFLAAGSALALTSSLSP
jgi:hypothetical protein